MEEIKVEEEEEEENNSKINNKIKDPINDEINLETKNKNELNKLAKNAFVNNDLELSKTVHEQKKNTNDIQHSEKHTVYYFYIFF